jgi:hypothetical protein
MCLTFRSHLLQNLSDVSKHIIIPITLPHSGFGLCVLEIMIIISYHLIHVVLFFATLKFSLRFQYKYLTP